jgi:hypothetical protein
MDRIRGGSHPPPGDYSPYDGSAVGGDQQVQVTPSCLSAGILQETIAYHPVVFLWLSFLITCLHSIL